MRSGDRQCGAYRRRQGAKGSLRTTRPDDLAAAAIQGALDGCRLWIRNRRCDHRLRHARSRAGNERGAHRFLRAGLPVEAGAMTVNRFCASGLQAIALAAERIRGGGADVIVAGGAESMSLRAHGREQSRPSIRGWWSNYPGSYLSMGLTAERVAKHYGITREEADHFAFESHQKRWRRT